MYTLCTYIGLEINFHHFLSKIGHLLWKNGTVCFISNIVQRLVVFFCLSDSLRIPLRKNTSYVKAIRQSTQFLVSSNS